MPDNASIPEQDRLRLSPEDATLLWGVLDAFKGRQGDARWPRLDRIVFDLEMIMRKHEEIPNGQ